MSALATRDLEFSSATPLTPASVRYWLMALGYLSLYLAMNVVTDSHHLRGSGITLWSPDNALSVLAIMQSVAFAPVVLAAQILADICIHKVNFSYSTIVSSELVLAFGYTLISIVLRDYYRVDVRRVKYQSLLTVMVIVPAGAAVTGVLYCGVLWATGALPAKEFLVGFANFWIGDTVGMGVVIPAASAMFDVARRGLWRDALKPRLGLIALALAAGTIAMIIHSAGNMHESYLFNLLFLPALWVAITFGYNTTCIALLFTQFVLVAALTAFDVGDADFGAYQILMFILAVCAQVLGAVVTERETATEQIRKQQAELGRVSAQATTGAMAAAMAHEISQPLASLGNYVHSARRLIDGGEGLAQVRFALLKAEGEAGRARAIIERIRDFVARGDMRLEQVELRDVVEKILRLNSDEARASGVDLLLVAAESHISATVDRIAIEQAVNNLVVNAMEASSRDGRVTVRLTTEADSARIEVED